MGDSRGDLPIQVRGSRPLLRELSRMLAARVGACTCGGGLGLRIWDLRFRIWGAGFMEQGVGFRV